MPAEDAVHIKILRIADDRLLKLSDKADDIFHLGLDVGAQRPVSEPENAADEIHETVAPEEDRIADGAGMGQPPHVLDHGIEFVAVNDEQAAAVRRMVNCIFLKGDARVGAEEPGKKLVVIADDIDDLGCLAAFGEEFVDDGVGLLGTEDW